MLETPGFGSLTFLAPVYNEKESLRELVERCRRQAAELGFEFRMILVDDASTDGSQQELRTLAREYPEICVLFLRAHFGKSAALAAGFAEADTQWVVTLDSDLQDQPEELPKLIEAARQGADIVSGWKASRQDPLTRRISSRMFNRVASAFAGQRFHDCNSGFKLYRADMARDFVLDGSRHRLVMLLAKWRGCEVAEVQVRHEPRRFGKSKYGPFRAFAGLFDLLGLLLVEKFLNRPLHFFGTAGLLAFLAGGLCIAYLTVMRVLHLGLMTTRPAFYVSILAMILGANCFTTGLLAEFHNAHVPRPGSRFVRERIGRSRSNESPSRNPGA